MMFGLDLPGVREQAAGQFREAFDGVLRCRHGDCENNAVAATSFEYCSQHAFEGGEGE